MNGISFKASVLDRRRHHQRGHQQRQRLHHVDDALHDQVEPAAEIT
jgi:hypothetical protein